MEVFYCMWVAGIENTNINKRPVVKREVIFKWKKFVKITNKCLGLK